MLRVKSALQINGTLAAVAVPEPATLGLGLVGAALLIRRWGKGADLA